MWMLPASNRLAVKNPPARIAAKTRKNLFIRLLTVSLWTRRSQLLPIQMSGPLPAFHVQKAGAVQSRNQLGCGEKCT
jgi:hypothetical protein